jgi:hypothetical protein
LKKYLKNLKKRNFNSKEKEYFEKIFKEFKEKEV